MPTSGEHPSIVSGRSPALSHVAADGSAQMVDVSEKPESLRVATASGRVFVAARTLELIDGNEIAKGNVLATARLAGIQAAKQTSALIPLCHGLLLQHVQVGFQIEDASIQIRCEVRTIGRTGAEMEALTGVSVAALTIYDMCKAVDKHMRIGDIALERKSKAPLPVRTAS